jgi:hypothetical protein
MTPSLLRHFMYIGPERSPPIGPKMVLWIDGQPPWNSNFWAPSCQFESALSNGWGMKVDDVINPGFKFGVVV